MRLLALVLACAAPVCAQGLHPGIKVGVPATTYFQTGRAEVSNGSAEYSAATRRYTLGVSLEWQLSGSFGVELDAMYKRMGYVGIFESPAERIAYDSKGNSWEFPLLVKYRFGGRVRPCVAGGPTLRYIGPIRALGERIVGATRTPIDTTEPSDLRKRFYPGLAAAVGIELGHGRLRWLPELRYTRWTANIAGHSGPLRFNPNQGEFLLECGSEEAS